MNWFLDLKFLVCVLSFFLRLHAHRLWAVLWLHQVCHWTERALPRVKRCPASNRCPIQTRSKVQPPVYCCHWLWKTATRLQHQLIWFYNCAWWVQTCMCCFSILYDRLMCLLKCDVWVTQASGGGKPGDGIVREAAYWGPAENQEEVERGERRQTGAALLQVSTQTRTEIWFVKLCIHMVLDYECLLAIDGRRQALNHLFPYQYFCLWLKCILPHVSRARTSYLYVCVRTRFNSCSNIYNKG